MSQPHGNAGQCAGTTRFIARSLEVAGYQRRYAPLFPAGCIVPNRQLLAAAGDGAFLRAAGNGLFRAAFQAVTGLILPGITPHYLARKRFLEETTLGVGNGCRQVVVLGAGLDTLAWRLHRRLPDIHFIELDREGAIRIKARAMDAAGEDHRNLSLLAADLADETLPAALARCPRYDPRLSTLFIAEGLFMYLAPDRVNTLVDEITAANVVAGTHFLAFTFMEARADGRIRFRRSSRVVDWWMRRGGEPFRSSCDPAKISGWLENRGWRVCEIVTGDDLRVRYLNPAGLQRIHLATGECIAVAQSIEKP